MILSKLKSVSSILNEMQEGREYQSIIGLAPAPNLDLMDEVVRALKGRLGEGFSP